MEIETTHPSIPSFRDNIACILLAAGRSQRFGSQKLLAPFGEWETMLDLTLQTYTKVFKHIVLVESRQLAQRYQCSFDHVMRVQNPDPHGLMSSSIKEGIENCISMNVNMTKSVLDAPLYGIVIALADMPCVKATTLERLVEYTGTLVANDASSRFIVAPHFNGKRGHPVIFSRHFSEQLIQLKGDKGARELIVAHADALHLVPTNDKGVVLDIDTPFDMARANNSP